MSEVVSLLGARVSSHKSNYFIPPPSRIYFGTLSLDGGRGVGGGGGSHYTERETKIKWNNNISRVILE